MRKLRKFLKIFDFGTGSLPHIQGSFSQFGEDFFLRWEFPRKANGFYIEVGGFDPYYFSNTHYLHSLGWRGMTIEPNPPFHAKFVKARPQDINLNIAASDHVGELNFYHNEMCSGVAGRDYPHEIERLEAIKVPCAPLEKILDEHLPEGQEIDFMSIDCEGHDAKVVAGNDWNRYRPEILLL